MSQPAALSVPSVRSAVSALAVRGHRRTTHEEWMTERLRRPMCDRWLEAGPDPLAEIDHRLPSGKASIEQP